MRIVAGRFRGRAIASPKDEDVRPTSDRVRESLFNILEHGVEGFSLQGARAIDLFAGTGALGLEALSRGAAFCLFVDSAVGARALIRTNIEALQLTGETRIFRRDATQLGEAGTIAPFTLAFLDPPYGAGLATRALASLASGAWLAPGAIAVVEERADAMAELPQGFFEIDRRTYGETQVLLTRYGAAYPGSRGIRIHSRM
jgi:16S rRNA (guanine966-N2)-methyltransferase